MIKYIHEHIIEEIKTNTRTDTILVLTAIILNLIILSINSALSVATVSNLIQMFIFISLILVINIVVEIGLIKGKQTRTKLITGLLLMYKDNDVDKYYDKSLLDSYKIRYTLFMIVVLCTGIVAIIVPLISID